MNCCNSAGEEEHQTKPQSKQANASPVILTPASHEKERWLSGENSGTPSCSEEAIWPVVIRPL